jgi:hypothetical protein
MPRRNEPKQRQQQTDEQMDDDILAPNSDTEGEPLAKRHKHIAEIANHVRRGGDLFLISTTLRGPITQNPWRRQNPVLDIATEKATATPKKRKRKAEPVRKTVAAAKDGKVNQFFPAQKNSQERETTKNKAGRKYALEVDDPIISDDTPKPAKTTSAQTKTLARIVSPSPVKAVPRMIDFDQVPPSASLPSSNFPSLQIVRMDDEPGQRLSPLSDSQEKTQDANGSATGDDGLGLVDEPTPKTKTVKKLTPASPTKHDLESIRNLVGSPSHEEQSENALSQIALFDEPTPPNPVRQPSPSKLAPIPSQMDFSPILPSSVTRYSRNSPKKSPLDMISPLSHLNRPISAHRRTNDRRRSSSSSSLLPSLIPTERIPLQRSQTHNGVVLTAPSPPLDTQAFFAAANESFNKAFAPPSPSPSLLPAAPLLPSRKGFTPFKELNRSPTPKDHLTFRLSSAATVEGSPLTYSPVNQEALWNDISGILEDAKWDLNEEVAKVKRRDGGDNGGGSQEVVVGA